jgi:hypothetical protein
MMRKPLVYAQNIARCDSLSRPAVWSIEMQQAHKADRLTWFFERRGFSKDVRSQARWQVAVRRGTRFFAEIVKRKAGPGRIIAEQSLNGGQID